MRAFYFVMLVGFFAFAGCGSDDSSGPGPNQPPYFTDPPEAGLPNALLLSVVPGDQISLSARAVDPDVEPVAYLWELVDAAGETVTDQGGTLTGAQSSDATWTISDFDGILRARCTITDGSASTSAVTRSYRTGFPLSNQVVSSDLTLDEANSPYVVIGGLQVQAGATLTLEPGVELQVRPGGGAWERHELRIEGVLEANGLIAAPVTIKGGYSRDPASGGGSAQLKGIVAAPDGQVSLTYTNVKDAETGLLVLSVENSSASNCNFTDCSTGIRIEEGTGTMLQGVLFRDNSIGLQVNSAGAIAEDCVFRSSATFGINLDASTDNASLLVTGGEFQGNVQAHVRMASLSGRLIAATIRGTNFLQQSNDAPAINLFASCSVYTLDLRGNYWGSAVSPQDIVEMFAGDRTCGADVLSWTDSDCGGDPENCDWSNIAW